MLNIGLPSVFPSKNNQKWASTVHMVWSTLGNLLNPSAIKNVEVDFGVSGPFTSVIDCLLSAFMHPEMRPWRFGLVATSGSRKVCVQIGSS